MAKLKERTITMSYDNFEAAIGQFLYAMGVLRPNEELVDTDFGIEVNENGLIEFDITVMDFGKGQGELQLVVDNGASQPTDPH